MQLKEKHTMTNSHLQMQYHGTRRTGMVPLGSRMAVPLGGQVSGKCTTHMSVIVKVLDFVLEGGCAYYIFTDN